jgi:transposase
LFESIACTPAAGWEKGQVENQVGLVRRRFFTPRLKVKDFAELNAYLMERCIGWAKIQRHPTIQQKNGLAGVSGRKTLFNQTGCRL